MTFQPGLWSRFEFRGTPIYVRGDRPDWFVPNEAGDKILQHLKNGGLREHDIQTQRFLDRLPDDPPRSYRGRAEHLQTGQLRELWFHLTDRCNQSCRHCLFACGPGKTTELATGRVRDLAGQAADLGCRVFALTGGEPLVHPGFESIVTGLLGQAGTHVVILTNGTLLQDHAAALDSWPADRVHLQISIDGLGPRHDEQRGRGAFEALKANLAWLQARGLACTLAMCVTAANVNDMPGLVDFAGVLGVPNLHFLWYFERGRGDSRGFAPLPAIFAGLEETAARAARLGVGIDNLVALRSQVFAPAGTIHDGAGGGWESLAIGPDGQVYPSPALVGVKSLATPPNGGLEPAWRQSPVLEELRRTSAAGLTSPWRFLLGGGDPDHSYTQAGVFVGGDPYWPLHEQIAQWLIAREAARQPINGPPRLRLKMGDRLESCQSRGAVALTHSNCLLGAAADSRTVVQDFYRSAATAIRQDILNPVCYPPEFMSHVPPPLRFRGYGCGSPVLEARLQPGEKVLDLGCGTGVECFIAAGLVGAQGQVTGVDMLDAMLSRARQGLEEVAGNLGYANLEFKQGFLEELPIPAASLDVVLSNCVINLSGDKRRTFAEIFRVLKPGGRLVISDVVCETDPDPTIRNDEVLRAECLAGALTQRDLFGLLEESGFVAALVRTRFPYREIRGHRFFSMTYEARKPGRPEPVQVMYRGPFPALITSRGDILETGVTRTVVLDELAADPGNLFVFQANGTVTNVAMAAPACCASGLGVGGLPGGAGAEPTLGQTAGRHPADCLVCGAPLQYLESEGLHTCAFCGAEHLANARCSQGHFVCDACHTRDARAFLEHACRVSRKTDLVALFQELRSHPAMNLHGPEHHMLVPGVILAVYRNLGGEVSEELLGTALKRGQAVPGGYCAFTGACGAALGVGIAFSLLLGANPVKPGERQRVQQITQAVLREQAKLAAARCCQRESWLALKVAAVLSREFLPLELRADYPLHCRQASQNRECLGSRCPLWKG